MKKSAALIFSTVFILFLLSHKASADQTQFDDYCLESKYEISAAWPASEKFNCIFGIQHFDTTTPPPNLPTSGKITTLTLKIGLKDSGVGTKSLVVFLCGTLTGCHNPISYFFEAQGTGWQDVPLHFSPEDTVDLNVEKLSSIFLHGVDDGTFAFSATDAIPGENNYVSSTFHPFGTTRDLYFLINASPVNNPVLIVPGILGTEMKNDSNLLWLDLIRAVDPVNDDSFMDPLALNLNLSPIDPSIQVLGVIKKKGVPKFEFDYTDSLITEFVGQGYTEEIDLFTFPYDWRYGVSGTFENGSTTVDLLKTKINQILQQTGAQKVDIVAHSTGGLLVKKYVVDNNDHKIRKAVFVGVPNLGAPKAVKVLLMGDNFGVLGLLDEEMRKISRNMPVSYDLSPSQKYYASKGSYVQLYTDIGTTFITQDLDFNQTNDFLTNDHGLNSTALTDAHNLHSTDFDNFDLRTKGVDLYNIVGCKSGTVGKIVEKRREWPNQDPVIFGYDMKSVPGDGTVPLESSTNLPVDPSHKFYSLKANHGKMLSQNGIRQEIVNIIANAGLSVDSDIITQDIARCKLKGKAVSIFSPLNIEVIDQDGNFAGLAPDGSIQNDIPNAGFDILGEHKFVFLPNDESQTYTIKIKGTGTGTFTLKNQEINDDEPGQTAVFNNVPVTPSLTGQLDIMDDALILDTDGNGINDATLTPTSILDSNQSLDLIPPTTVATATGTPGNTGFYLSNVNINLFAIDQMIVGHELEISGVLKTSYSLDAGPYQDYNTSTPISITTEGPHILKFFSIDKAGNQEAEQTLSFTIDKTPPEIAVQFDLASNDFQFSVLDLNTSLSCANTSCTAADTAGNSAVLNFAKTKILLGKSLTLKSINYNGANASLPANALVVNLSRQNGQLKLFSQTELINNQQILNINYLPKTNQSAITTVQKNLTFTTTYQPGIKFLQILTDKGILKTAIK